MNIKNEIRYIAGHPATIVGAIYLGATLAINTLIYGAQASFEAIENAPTQEVVARLDEVKQAKFHTGGTLDYGVFTLQDGTTTEFIDSARILEGKFLPNRIIPNLEAGKEYTLTSIDSFFGNVVLTAEENQGDKK